MDTNDDIPATPPVARPVRTFTRSPTIGKLAGALAKAQGAMHGAIKDSANPFFKSKYADLASIWDAIREPLSSNDLAVLQFARSPAYGVIEVETALVHSSDEMVAETLTMPASQWVNDAKTNEPWEKFDVQTIGSAITYARRYGLQSICGVAPEDDDGNGARQDTKAGQDAAAKARNALIATLTAAADNEGTFALEAQWKAMTKDQRVSLADELPRLKKRAADTDNQGDARE